MDSKNIFNTFAADTEYDLCDTFKDMFMPTINELAIQLKSKFFSLTYKDAIICLTSIVENMRHSNHGEMVTNTYLIANAYSMVKPSHSAKTVFIDIFVRLSD